MNFPRRTRVRLITPLTRRTALAALTSALLSAGLAAPLSAHAQAPLQEITYLLPAAATLPAFGPWIQGVVYQPVCRQVSCQ